MIRQREALLAFLGLLLARKETEDRFYLFHVVENDCWRDVYDDNMHTYQGVPAVSAEESPPE